MLWLCLNCDKALTDTQVPCNHNQWAIKDEGTGPGGQLIQNVRPVMMPEGAKILHTGE